jgi:hypothetical protein
MILRHFDLGPDNHLHIVVESDDPFYGSFPLLPMIIGCSPSLPNLENLTALWVKVHVDRGGRRATMEIRASKAGKETFRVTAYLFCYPRDNFPRRSNAMQILDYFDPLDLGEVTDLHIEGFDDDWEIWEDEFYGLLGAVPSLVNLTS